MKKQYFNFGLYREALRQSRMITILVTVLISIVSAFTVILTWINLMEQKMRMESLGEAFVKQPLSGQAACAALICIGLLAAPLMTFALYSFQNKRNTSDFYHSLPHTRLCLFLSYQAAILTQVVFSILTCALFSSLLCLMASSHIVFVVTPLLWYALSTFALSVLTSAAVAMAMSITGTPFNNLILSGLILFLPRCLLLLFALVLEDMLFNAVSGHFMPFFQPSLNLLSGIFFLPLDMTSLSWNQLLANLPSILYTLGLGIAYTALAAYFFHRRKSEAAGFSAPNRILQATYRIIVGTAVTVIPTIALYNMIIEDSFSTGDLELCVIFWTIGIVAYLLYELLTTKKWKNLVKALPGLGIVLAANLLCVGMMHAAYTAELNYTPAPEQIKSISVVNDDVISYGWQNFANYAKSKSQDVEIDDPEIISALSRFLKQNVTDYKTLRSYDFYQKYSGSGKYDVLGSLISEPYRASYFRIDTAFGSKYRRIWYDAELADLITEVMESKDEYRRIWTTLPSMIPGTARIESGIFYRVSSSSFTEEQSAKIFATLKEEIRSCDFSTWYTLLTQPGLQEKNAALFNLYYSYLDGNDTRTITVPVFPSIAPKTQQMILTAFNQNPEKIKENLADARNAKTDMMHVSCTADILFPSSKYNETQGVYFNSIADERIDLILDNLGTFDQVSTEAILVCLSLEWTAEDDDGRYNYHNSWILLPLQMSEAQAQKDIFLKEWEEEVKYPELPLGDGIVRE